MRLISRRILRVGFLWKPLRKQKASYCTNSHARKYEERAKGHAKSVQEAIDILTPYIKSHRLEKMKSVLQDRWGGVSLILENISSGHNAAACLRSAEGLGVHYVHVVDTFKKRVRPWEDIHSCKI